jgi:hypothetical protein
LEDVKLPLKAEAGRRQSKSAKRQKRTLFAEHVTLEQDDLLDNFIGA